MFSRSHHSSNKPVTFCLSTELDMAIRCRVVLSTILQHNCTLLSKLLLFTCVQNTIFYTVPVRLKLFSLSGRQCVQYQRQTEINKGQTLRFLGAFVQPRKSPVGSSRPSVRMTANISVAPTGRISVKFNIGDV